MNIMKATMLAATAIASPIAAQDSYQWLEVPTDAKALDWAKQQTQAAEAKIATMPDHAAVLHELKTALSAANPPPEFLLAGPYALRFQRSAERPHGVLSVSRRKPDGTPGAWRDVIDVDALGKAEGKAYELRFDGTRLSCRPEGNNRCILQLSPGGGDEDELREFDLDTGAFVADGFRTPASRTMAAWLNDDTLLLEHTISGARTLSTGWARDVLVWKRGTPLSSAKVVYSAQPGDSLMMLNATGTGANRVGIIQRAIDYSTFEHLKVGQDGSVKPLPFPLAVKMGTPVVNGGRVYVQLAQTATVMGQAVPAESIVAYDFNPGVAEDRRYSVAYRANKDEFLVDAYSGIAATNSGMLAVMSKRGIQQVIRANARANGKWTLTRDKPEPVGTNVGLLGADRASDAVIVKRAGFLVPTRLDLVGRRLNDTLFSEKPAFDATKFIVELKSAPSKDGTSIDYYLLRPKAPSKGDVPLLMTGYGAFGISFVPGYLDLLVGGKSLLTWLNRGGALALPLIRGGGDRGEAWHQAAIREKRENSYDDFAAVTQALIREKFTTPRRIGVFGMSNGGLLAAVMGTRHPELYGAIVSDVPLTDLVRMPYMGMGAAWTNEYGDPKEPAMLAAINRYSPYQNVVPGKAYPPFMITVATSDNRVGPGHARKLAARMKDAGATVYYLEDQNGGHGVSDPLNRPDLMANRMTFLIDTLIN
ncbi:prolyl oligopeptidase family serine peptidase (plasmid) [Novosphingobium resinovorum]|uniref:prolyl oligopeptidase family serine peptidase n=1 Tax=Novosphingobium TaxID=165696 RepID=UPI001B3C571E|nr:MULTISPECIES: prolyl oligopeptidase family serine peptidase [Novosphingobium]MBF7015287.1 S9 family peptidase [Novosphingobium sp. HR1a]WJM29966.1 prolyl oligopeptidase family serine peptidase [Novosphingobium resinovorum]